MSKPIRSYPEGERKAVVARRLASKTGGLGYLAAVDYQRRKDAGEKKPAPAPAAENPT
jgi:hypothetical protein